MNITKELKGNSLLIHLSGVVDESANLDKTIGTVPAELQVECSGIVRLNSVGVKGWIKFFQGIQQKGTKIRYVNCSSAIVEQFNQISNFSCGGVVESMQIPFSCAKCKTQFEQVFPSAYVKEKNFEIPDVKCQKCDAQATFDDIPDEYFRFMMG